MQKFEQCIDTDRPHTLLTLDVKTSGSLEYRYDDTLEVVTVPNIWYNQSYQTRIAAIRWEAQVQDEHAVRILRNPPLNCSLVAAADIARRYRARAERIRAEAVRMATAGQASHPVAASRMPLDYGELVR